MVEVPCHPQQPRSQEPVLFTSPVSGLLVERRWRRSWLVEMLGCGGYFLWGEMQVVPGAVLIRVPTLFLFPWFGRPRYRWYRVEAAQVQSVQVMWPGYRFFGWAFSFFARDRTRGIAEAHLLPLSAFSFLHVGERMRRFLVALRQAGFQVEDHVGLDRRSDFALWFRVRGFGVFAVALAVVFLFAAILFL